MVPLLTSIAPNGGCPPTTRRELEPLTLPSEGLRKPVRYRFPFFCLAIRWGIRRGMPRPHVRHTEHANYLRTIKRLLDRCVQIPRATSYLNQYIQPDRTHKPTLKPNYSRYHSSDAAVGSLSFFEPGRNSWLRWGGSPGWQEPGGSVTVKFSPRAGCGRLTRKRFNSRKFSYASSIRRGSHSSAPTGTGIETALGVILRMWQAKCRRGWPRIKSCVVRMSGASARASLVETPPAILIDVLAAREARSDDVAWSRN